MSLAMISPTPANSASQTEVVVTAASAPVLQLVDLRKTFGDFAAVDGISVDIKEGEFVTIVGPSGSGKTTLLRMLAGMETPSDGYITLRGTLINDVPADKRPTCLVFQSLALFPHKTVGENIEFPLKVRKMSAPERKARALELMRMVRLPEHYHSKNVMRCSGGEKQRVALARAFAYDPEVLFFDEPLSALDYKLKKVLEKELKDLHRESGKTFIYITHSLEEAMVMSDRVGVMNRGRLVQIGTPEDIYTRPANRFVAEFFGEVNSFDVKRDGKGGWTLADGQPISVTSVDEVVGETATVIVRPEIMRFVTGPSTADNLVTGKIYNEYSLGSRMQYQIHSGNRIYLVEAPRAVVGGIASGDTVTIGWDARDAIVVGGVTMAVTTHAEPASRPRAFPAVPAGLRAAGPVVLLLILGFLAPLLTVAAYSFATPKSFDVFRSFTFANFEAIFSTSNTVWMSFAWSLAYALATVALLAVIAYPIAYGLNRMFGKWSGFVGVLFVFPLFVSENVRLYGWVLFFIKNGVLDGGLRWLGFSGGPEVLYTPGVILFGMLYVYLPFMLFPMSLGIAMIPKDLIDAARDLGASRMMIWREIELPLAMPGILIGALLTFVLGAGAIAESKILGGQSVITIAQDIEVAFTYAQNWPLGSALALLLVLIVSGLALYVLSKLDLDRILGKR